MMPLPLGWIARSEGRRLPRVAAFTCSAWLAAAVAVPAARSLELGMPLDCRPGLDCWPVRLVDHDPGPGFADHRCGRLGSDGHDGVDFAIRDPQRMAEGVPVLAAAAGVVRGGRDGEPDQPPDGRLAVDYGDRNCGNGVVIAHEDGWSTQYCHMRRGSVAVRPGDKVEAGDRLGLVGMSGEANFPHVHLIVRRGEEATDPFTGGPPGEPCGGQAEAAAPLWRAELLGALRYQPVVVASVGLADAAPQHGEIVSGTADDRPLRSRSPALVGYALAYGLARGDRLTLRITGPAGDALAELPFAIDQDSPRATRSGGRRAPEGGWPAGGYKVEAVVERDGERWSASRVVEVAQ